MIIYRILFQLFNYPDIHQNLDNKEFWRRVVSFLRNESKGKIGAYLKESIPNLDFSPKNLWSISKIDPNLKKIVPSNFSKKCGTTGFVVFYIKDCLEYCGLIDDKKGYKSNYKFQLYKKKIFEELVKRLN